MNVQFSIVRRAASVSLVAFALFGLFSLPSVGAQQPMDARLMVLPERLPFWERADLDVELIPFEPVFMLEELVAMIDSGEQPELAELPIDVAYALGLERPDTFVDIPQTIDVQQLEDMHPFMFQGQFAGFDMNHNRVLVPLQPDRWPLDTDIMERTLEIIRRLYCVERVVAVSGTGGPGQQQFDDSADDFLLNHPLFEIEFEIPPFDPDDPLLRGLDILAAEYIPNGDITQFVVALAGEDALQRMPETPQAIQVGILLDINQDGASDYTVVTADVTEGALLLTNSYEYVADVTLHIDGDRVLLDVPALRLGETFDWAVYTAYSPDPEAFYVAANAEAPVVEVSVAPIVDIAYALPDQRTYQIQQIQQQTQQGQQGQLGQTVVFFCPAGSPGDTLLWEQTCSDRTVRLSCQNGAFARWVSNRSVNPPSEGYMARCPYSGGINGYREVTTSFPNVPEEIEHWIEDPSSKEIMRHKYVFGTDELFSSHESPNRTPTDCQPHPAKLHQYLWQVPPDATCP